MREHIPEIVDVERKLDDIEGRDLQLWSIVILTIVVLGGGFAALVAPNLWYSAQMKIESRYLPQLLYGLVTLIVLFNLYAMGQRRVLFRTRRELIAELARRQAAEVLSFKDPLTETYNRRYMQDILAKEVVRADRAGTAVTLVMVDIDDFKAVNTRFGHLTGDTFLKEAAGVLKKSVRETDSIIRYGGDEFLMVLFDANEQQALYVTTRLRSATSE